MENDCRTKADESERGASGDRIGSIVAGSTVTGLDLIGCSMTAPAADDEVGMAMDGGRGMASG